MKPQLLVDTKIDTKNLMKAAILQEFYRIIGTNKPSFCGDKVAYFMNVKFTIELAKFLDNINKDNRNKSRQVINSLKNTVENGDWDNVISQIEHIIIEINEETNEIRLVQGQHRVATIIELAVNNKLPGKEYCSVVITNDTKIGDNCDKNKTRLVKDEFYRNGITENTQFVTSISTYIAQLKIGIKNGVHSNTNEEKILFPAAWKSYNKNKEFIHAYINEVKPILECENINVFGKSKMPIIKNFIVLSSLYTPKKICQILKFILDDNLEPGKNISKFILLMRKTIKFTRAQVLAAPTDCHKLRKTLHRFIYTSIKSFLDGTKEYEKIVNDEGYIIDRNLLTDEREFDLSCLK